MTLYTNIDSNKRKTVFLLGVFLLTVIILGWLISYVLDSPLILWLAVVLALGQALLGYYSGDRIALLISGARAIEKKENPNIYNIVENLSITAGLPVPKIYIIDDPAPNAFATGRDPKHASLAVTTGLIEQLNKTELEGVVAHELSHIGNFDVRLMTIIVVLVGVVSLLSDLFLRFRFFSFSNRDRNSEGGQLQLVILIVAILAAVLAPIAATLIQLAISRKREFLADSAGALLTRYPEGLASALLKISRYNQPLKHATGATAHLYIENPLGKKQSYLSKLFSTHPPVEERIAALTGKK
jgi:heat shock protein HtpX